MEGKTQDQGSTAAVDGAAAASIKALALPHIEKAINTVVEVMENGERDGQRLSAAFKLLDLAVGKAGQAEGSPGKDRDDGVDEILRQMRERARRMRAENGGSSGGASP